ncbi:MAG TPA: acyl-CoA dehydrogenase family protein [Kofleriaceae bacterium]|nr:acyl-CoA dehydrogenase family protein [Kofleriaceae bacterium]
MSIRYDDMKEAIGLNWYLVDPNLRFQIDRAVEAADRDWVEDKLRAMGALIGGPVARNAEITDRRPAELVRWDREGDEINQVVHPASALETKRLLWKSDFLHLRWSEEVAGRGRPVPAALLMAYPYLLSQAETGMLCSIGMTTGVLRLIERYGDAETRELFCDRLRINDHDRGWDGSMYLTERAGGSDLGATETTARREDGRWRLDGSKWFCSNVDGQAIVTLARPEGSPAGIKGLALFAVPRVFPDGRPNGVHIRRIKEKLGTRAVPTGEIDLVGATGYLLTGGQEARDGRGINRMMEFVNESRLAVAAMGAGIMRRAFLEAAIRAEHRRAFGRALVDHGMVREQLLDLLVASEAAAAMLFVAGGRLPRPGQGLGEGDPLTRIMVPITKMRCTRGGVESASAALEIFGGNGYIENFPLARQLRDAQCHTLWEGTENILALDMLRACARDRAHTALFALLDGVAAGAEHPVLAETRASLVRARGRLAENLARLVSAGPEVAALRARVAANDAADAVQAALLLDEARWELDDRGSARKAVVAAWFARTRLEPHGRWHPGNERIVLDLFDAVIRYQPIDPDRAAAAVRPS